MRGTEGNPPRSTADLVGLLVEDAKARSAYREATGEEPVDSFTCSVCGFESYHLKDIELQWCRRCKGRRPWRA